MTNSWDHYIELFKTHKKSNPQEAMFAKIQALSLISDEIMLINEWATYGNIDQNTIDRYIELQKLYKEIANDN